MSTDISAELSAHLPELLQEGEQYLGYIECRGVRRLPIHSEQSVLQRFRPSIPYAFLAIIFPFCDWTFGLDMVFGAVLFGSEPTALIITDQGFHPVFFEGGGDHLGSTPVKIIEHQFIEYASLSSLRVKRDLVGGSITFKRGVKQTRWSVIGRHFIFAQVEPFLKGVAEKIG